uniref:Uncharacterized protein n=1 Tax=Arundo donax TaxID=35708 RepID=A0A0A9EW01_ARUDO
MTCLILSCNFLKVQIYFYTNFCPPVILPYFIKQFSYIGHFRQVSTSAVLFVPSALNIYR